MNHSHAIWLCIALVATAVVSVIPDSALSQPYLRAGILLDRAQDTRLEDSDCSSTDRLLLFGCENGNGEIQDGSVVDFDNMTGWEVGVGYPMLPILRLELAVQYRPEFSFEGRTNLEDGLLLDIAGEQEVSADLSLWSALLATYLDISLPILQFTPVTPFLGAGVGLSRIEINDIRMDSPIASLVVPGDYQVSMSWMLTVGVGVSLANWTIDAALRYTDHGDIETAAGIGRRICRIANCDLPDLPPELEPTIGTLQSQGFTLSLRYSF